MKKSCAFTGHRPTGFAFGYDEEDPRCIALKRQLLNQITDLAHHGYRIFYTGMAEGVDIWAAEAVLQLSEYFKDIELYAAIPFRAQRDTMKDVYQKRYDRILEKTAEQIVISETYTRGCYKRRNYFMVEQCDALIAVYNAKHAKSGTGQTIRKAQADGKEVYQIDPDQFYIPHTIK
ncbi:MAG: DUF1273 domain-containing protein [Clostridiales bacterium]|nr:DUF1273 domain-containing protein [Clostridiales bacterium]